MLPMHLEKISPEMGPAPEAQAHGGLVPPARIRSIVMRWNRQWIGGDRFVRDYAAGVISFDAEVTQAVCRLHPTRYRLAALVFETHAATWAAVLVAFEAACFREPDREILLAALLGELRVHWSQDEVSDSTDEAAILEHAQVYFALRDSGSRLKTATSLVNLYLRSAGLPDTAASSALARHLCAGFGYHILRDIFRLSSASRLRTAAVSLVERQKARAR